MDYDTQENQPLSPPLSEGETLNGGEPRPFVKPKFIARKTGKCYSFACVFVQLGGTALLLVAMLVSALLTGNIENPAVTYLAYSTQILLAGVVVWYAAKHKTGFADLKIKRAKPIPFLMAVLFGLGVIVCVNPIESVFTYLLSLIGYEADISAAVDVPLEGGYFFLALFLIAVMPAVFEELLMRSIVLNGSKECGTAFRVLMNGLLFSLFHANPSQTCYTFLMGCAFALIAIRCDSVVPTMILHFFNNALSLFLMKFNIVEIPDTAYVIALAVGALLVIAGLVYFLKLNKTGNAPRAVRRSPFVLGCLCGIIFNAALWLFVFFTYHSFI